MSNHHSRRIVRPGESRKRKELEEPVYFSQTSRPEPAVSVTKATTSSTRAGPISGNRLLAGYMAHEFLTKGTLMGRHFDLALAEAIPVSNAGVLSRGQSLGSNSQPSGKSQPNSQTYAEISSLLMNNGARIKGTVNPTQLGRWIQM